MTNEMKVWIALYVVAMVAGFLGYLIGRGSERRRLVEKVADGFVERLREPRFKGRLLWQGRLTEAPVSREIDGKRLHQGGLIKRA